jgi:hypothetical protein
MLMWFPSLKWVDVRLSPIGSMFHPGADGENGLVSSWGTPS